MALPPAARCPHDYEHVPCSCPNIKLTELQYLRRLNIVTDWQYNAEQIAVLDRWAEAISHTIEAARITQTLDKGFGGV